MNAQPNNNYFYNCKISAPVIPSDAKAVSFNGFAWSNSMGIIHESAPIIEQGWQQWLGTQQ